MTLIPPVQGGRTRVRARGCRRQLHGGALSRSRKASLRSRPPPRATPPGPRAPYTGDTEGGALTTRCLCPAEGDLTSRLDSSARRRGSQSPARLFWFRRLQGDKWIRASGAGLPGPGADSCRCPAMLGGDSKRKPSDTFDFRRASYRGKEKKGQRLLCDFLGKATSLSCFILFYFRHVTMLVAPSESQTLKSLCFHLPVLLCHFLLFRAPLC